MKTEFKDTEIGLIPEDWEVKPISEVSEISLGGTPKTSITKYWHGDVKWASAKDVSNCKSRYICDTERTVTKDGIDNSAAKILPENTIVITSRGTVGKLALLSEPMSFNQTCYGLKAKENMDSLFLYYILKNSINRIKSISYRTVFSTITVRTFDEIKLAYPSLNEQHHIAKILSDLDTKIELLQKQNKTLEAVGQAIFKHWFVDSEFPNEEGKPYKSAGGEMVDSELGEIPKGWEVKTIGDVATVKGGTTPSTKKQEYWDNGTIHWCTPKDLSNLGSPVLLDTERKITNKGLATISSGLLPTGTVLFLQERLLDIWLYLKFQYQ
ncbi:type I restriction enzyme, S subunit [Methanophagales archaeon]|nr:type I restriction enzyme, S subunit [Methanophagales archaeon]